MKKITLKEIAEDTGYSISTVSRVLTGSQKISGYAKEKIFKSATKLNYPVNKNINSSLNGHILKIALLISGFHKGEFYASFYKGFTEAAETDNIILSIVCIDQPKSTFIEVANRLCDTNDGLILFTPEFNRDDYLKLHKKLPSGFPIVSNGLIENPVFSTITFDSYSGGHLSAEYFHKNDYLSCGIIKGPQYKTEARYRYNGFRDYITQHTDMKLLWEFDGDYSFDSGTAAFNEFKEFKEKPRAIFASNDAMCHGFLETATKEGYNFPEDVAIIGFDDLPICLHHQPTISSISTPYHELGQLTFEMIKRIMSKSDNQNGMLSLLPVTLAERKSS